MDVLDALGLVVGNTEGVGAQDLAPTVLADGTKQFELTAAVTKWEVSPGKTVDAMTYNGTVPGPTLKVDPGDHVRILLHNKLPESTSIHFHGLITPNAMDGTTIVTQDPVKPGADYTYEWTVQATPAVGMVQPDPAVAIGLAADTMPIGTARVRRTRSSPC